MPRTAYKKTRRISHSFVLLPEMLEQIRTLAREADSSMSQVTEQLLRQALAAHGIEVGAPPTLKLGRNNKRNTD
jgi:hypothetical protein